MAIEKQIKPEDHPYYHSTKKLLKNYRDVVWHIEVASQDLQAEFRAEYGHSIDECLDTLEMAGADISNTRLEGFARSLERSRKMLQLIDSAVALLRNKHKRGELYYWILYYSYLCPQQRESINEILIALEEQYPTLSMRTFFTRRDEAIKALSTLLWGFTTKECADILDDFDL